LFYLNIIFNNNPLGTSIHLAHCGLSLKKFHHGKNWSLVFVALQKPPAFPHHCEVLKTDDTTVKGQTFNTVMNSDLICMTNGAPLTLTHTAVLRSHCPCPPTNDHKKLYAGTHTLSGGSVYVA
jgi:hypothetical protein